jgi:hypothetical protein
MLVVLNTKADNRFHREVVEKFPELRAEITEKLISAFGDIKSGKVYRGALWIVGEYCENADGKRVYNMIEDTTSHR